MLAVQRRLGSLSRQCPRKSLPSVLSFSGMGGLWPIPTLYMIWKLCSYSCQGLCSVILHGNIISLILLQTLRVNLKSVCFHLSRNHFDENAAQAPDVCCSSVTFPLRSGDDFRGHVRCRQKIQFHPDHCPKGHVTTTTTNAQYTFFFLNKPGFQIKSEGRKFLPAVPNVLFTSPGMVWALFLNLTEQPKSPSLINPDEVRKMLAPDF